MLTAEEIIEQIQNLDLILWSYIAVPCILLLALYLTIIHRVPQITKISHLWKVFAHAFKKQDQKVVRGITPFRALFSSLGGCIGIGNIVAIGTAVQIGGPGAVFWLWVAAFCGMIVKYAEVYLGIKYRITNLQGSYDGGPMFYLGKVYGHNVIPKIFSILLAMYGTEVYMFKVVSDSIALTWHLDSTLISYGLLIAILIVSRGGVDKVGQICSAVLPLFLTLFVSMSLWILIHSPIGIIDVFYIIIKAAFNGHAALGGFAGSTVMMAISQGMARACYSSDIGSGYASVVQSETSQQHPENQAIFEFFGVFIDAFVVSTLTTFVLISTGVWYQNIPASHLLQEAFSLYFNGMDYFIPFFISLLGFSNLLAFFAVGKKCVSYLQPRWGVQAYYCYAITMYLIFSHSNQRYALLMMSIIGVLLLLINIIGVFLLSHEVKMPDLQKNYFGRED
jgi:AGCS family alanine or glycine:cation symporter